MLREIDFLKGRSEDTLRQLEACIVARSCAAGEAIFRQGDAGDEIFLVTRGRVRISLRVGERDERHLATFGRGDAFGEIAFIDRGVRGVFLLLLRFRRVLELLERAFGRLGHGLLAVLAGRLEGRPRFG
jgi:SulP family sulfate permease